MTKWDLSHKYNVGLTSQNQQHNINKEQKLHIIWIDAQKKYLAKSISISWKNATKNT